MDEPRFYTWREHLLYGSILLCSLAIGLPLAFFLGAWILKGVVWYVELWMLLPWPPR
jgi:hypothetical protein